MGCVRIFSSVFVLIATMSGCGSLDSSPLEKIADGSNIRRSAPPTAAVKGGKAISNADHPAKTLIVEGTGRFVGMPASSLPIGARLDEGDVTLNLVKVPVAQAAKTVLGDLLSVRYTIDPNVKGDVTVQTPYPVSKAAVVDLLQAALKANGAVILNAGGHYRIVSAEHAMAGAPLRAGAATGEIGAYMQIVQLKYVAANEMQRILEPIAPKGSAVRADEARNTLTLSGNGQEIAAMVEAIGLFDIDTMKGMSFALVPVRSSQPTVIADELRNVFATSTPGPMAGMVRFVPNNRLRAVLVITPQPEYLARADAWVRKLDARAEGTERQFFTYSVQNRRAQDLVNVLRSLFSPEADTQSARHVAPPYQEALVQSQETQRDSAAGFVPFGSSRSRPQATAQPKEPIGPAASVTMDDATGAPRIRIAADPAKNALLLEATPADHVKLMRVIAALDVQPTQVVIEATIAEVSLNDDLKMGVRWFFKNKNAEHTFTDAASGAIGSVFPGFSYALAASNVGVTLNALNKITDVKVVSSPSLTVMDNSMAVLQIGDQVPITTQSAVGVLGVGAPVVNSVSYKDTGVILAITPRINASGRVLLEIEQEVSTVASTTTSNIDSPTIRQRRIKTSVFVKDGEALALGGMIQASNNTARGQIPLFGDLPVVGNAFRTRDNEISKTELIVIITPHVIRNFDEARQITEEYRRELSLVARPTGRALPNVGKTLHRLLE